MQNKFNDSTSHLLLQERLHQNCFACSQEHPFGLHLHFKQNASEEDRVTGRFSIPKSFEGYNGVVHGGIISTILDSAMTSLLLKKGVCALTAELNTRFKRPALPSLDIDVEASLDRNYSTVYELTAVMIQNGKLVARSKAKFMEVNSSKLG